MPAFTATAISNMPAFTATAISNIGILEIAVAVNAGIVQANLDEIKGASCAHTGVYILGGKVRVGGKGRGEGDTEPR